MKVDRQGAGGRGGRAGWAEQYVLTMATGILLYFHLLIEIAGTEKEKKNKHK